MRLRPVTRSILALLLGGTAVLTACSGDDKPVATPTPVVTTPSATPTPVPTESPLDKSPFTGAQLAEGRGRVLAIKIDNARAARPQAGLDKADIVFEELVEGGTTRFLVIFSSRTATNLGPVRSVRETDLPLLRMFGKVLFAFSGGNRGLLAQTGAAPLIILSPGTAPSAYYRTNTRSAPYNVFTSTELLFTAKGDVGAIARDIGWKFGLARASASKVKNINVSWSQRASTGFTYDPAAGVYLRTNDGVPARLIDGRRQTAPNVVVMRVKVHNGRYVDTAGSRSPVSETVGTGKVEVFRNGTRVSGTWRRPIKDGPLRFVDATGKDIPLKVGPVWVLLLPVTGATVSVS